MMEPCVCVCVCDRNKQKQKSDNDCFNSIFHRYVHCARPQRPQCAPTLSQDMFLHQTAALPSTSVARAWLSDESVPEVWSTISPVLPLAFLPATTSTTPIMTSVRVGHQPPKVLLRIRASQSSACVSCHGVLCIYIHVYFCTDLKNKAKVTQAVGIDDAVHVCGKDSSYYWMHQCYCFERKHSAVCLCCTWVC